MFDAVVIGAGIAGASAVKSLKNNGLNKILLMDRAQDLAQGASAHHHALCHPYIGRGASRLQRLTQLAFGAVPEVWGRYFHQSGVFHLAGPRFKEKKDLSEHLQTLGFDTGKTLAYGATEAYAEFGIEQTGTWFADGGYVNLQRAAQETLAELPKQDRLLGVEINAIRYVNKVWTIDLADGVTHRAKRVFICAGYGSSELLEGLKLAYPLKPVRGQLSYLRKKDGIQTCLPRVPLTSDFYYIPYQQEDQVQKFILGSTYDEHNQDLSPWPASHEANLEQFTKLLGPITGLEIEDAYVGIRCVAHDRMPVIGPVPNYPGLYVITALGSRAVMWTALAERLMSAHLKQELNQASFFAARFLLGDLAFAGFSDDLVSAFSPARFLAGVSNSKPTLPFSSQTR